MVIPSLSLREDYWETFELREEDVEFLYNYLLEFEMPMTPQELVEILVRERVEFEKQQIEQQRTSGGALYMPKECYKVRQTLVFPALSWEKGEVVNVRPGRNPDIGEFEVIEVLFSNGNRREYASSLADHILNTPPSIQFQDQNLDSEYVLAEYLEDLAEALEKGLEANLDFVRIAGRWFPRAAG